MSDIEEAKKLIEEVERYSEDVYCHQLCTLAYDLLQTIEELNEVIRTQKHDQTELTTKFKRYEELEAAAKHMTRLWGDREIGRPMHIGEIDPVLSALAALEGE